jgi:hypothetical protein
LAKTRKIVFVGSLLSPVLWTKIEIEIKLTAGVKDRDPTCSLKIGSFGRCPPSSITNFNGDKIKTKRGQKRKCHFVLGRNGKLNWNSNRTITIKIER